MEGGGLRCYSRASRWIRHDLHVERMNPRSSLKLSDPIAGELFVIQLETSFCQNLLDKIFFARNVAPTPTLRSPCAMDRIMSSPESIFFFTVGT